MIKKVGIPRKAPEKGNIKREIETGWVAVVATMNKVTIMEQNMASIVKAL